MTQVRIGRRAKMLCPVCREINRAYQNNDADSVFFKECPHSRTPFLLPSRKGEVGLEDVIKNTAIAQKLFPFVFCDDMVLSFEEHKQRRTWG